MKNIFFYILNEVQSTLILTSRSKFMYTLSQEDTSLTT